MNKEEKQKKSDNPQNAEEIQAGTRPEIEHILPESREHEPTQSKKAEGMHEVLSYLRGCKVKIDLVSDYDESGILTNVYPDGVIVGHFETDGKPREVVFVPINSISRIKIDAKEIKQLPEEQKKSFQDEVNEVLKIKKAMKESKDLEK